MDERRADGLDLVAIDPDATRLRLVRVSLHVLARILRGDWGIDSSDAPPDMEIRAAHVDFGALQRNEITLKVWSMHWPPLPYGGLIPEITIHFNATKPREFVER